MQRAKIVLLLADGVSARAVATKLEVSRPIIAKWRRRFLEGSVDGLTSHYTGRAPWKLTARVRTRVLAATRRPPPDGTTHWSCRRLAAHLGVGKDVVQRVWREADLRPHRLARYMASNDPDFETKAADVIGLYLDPPRHAAVFCVDEKTAIQALDRRDRVLPLSPGRIERHGFEYKRHRTLSLYAALNIQTGEVQGKTTARHTSQDFVGFLGEVVTTCEPAQEIHVILDNLSAHKTQTVAAFLDAHPNVKLHFTPTYSSWLNQVELWFSKVQRDVLSRGVFTSLADARKTSLGSYAATFKPTRSRPSPFAGSTTTRRDASSMGNIILRQSTRRPWQKARCIRAAMHPGWPRCSSVEYGQYAPSSRLAIQAPGRSRCDAGFHHGLLARIMREGAVEGETQEPPCGTNVMHTTF